MTLPFDEDFWCQCIEEVDAEDDNEDPTEEEEIDEEEEEEEEYEEDPLDNENVDPNCKKKQKCDEPSKEPPIEGEGGDDEIKDNPDKNDGAFPSTPDDEPVPSDDEEPTEKDPSTNDDDPIQEEPEYDNCPPGQYYDGNDCIECSSDGWSWDPEAMACLEDQQKQEPDDDNIKSQCETGFYWNDGECQPEQTNVDPVPLPLPRQCGEDEELNSDGECEKKVAESTDTPEPGGEECLFVDGDGVCDIDTEEGEEENPFEDIDPQVVINAVNDMVSDIAKKNAEKMKKEREEEERKKQEREEQEEKSNKRQRTGFGPIPFGTCDFAELAKAYQERMESLGEWMIELRQLENIDQTTVNVHQRKVQLQEVFLPRVKHELQLIEREVRNCGFDKIKRPPEEREDDNDSRPDKKQRTLGPIPFGTCDFNRLKEAKENRLQAIEEWNLQMRNLEQLQPTYTIFQKMQKLTGFILEAQLDLQLIKEETAKCVSELAEDVEEVNQKIQDAFKDPFEALKDNIEGDGKDVDLTGIPEEEEPIENDISIEEPVSTGCGELFGDMPAWTPDPELDKDFIDANISEDLKQLFVNINRYRLYHGLNPLKWSKSLKKVAKSTAIEGQHPEDLRYEVRLTSFSLKEPDGTIDMTENIAKGYYDGTELECQNVADNVLYQWHRSLPKDVGDPTNHHDNLLRDVSHMGLSVNENANGEKTYAFVSARHRSHKSKRDGGAKATPPPKNGYTWNLPNEEPKFYSDGKIQEFKSNDLTKGIPSTLQNPLAYDTQPKPSDINFFGLEVNGINNVVFIIDNSKSMNGEPYARTVQVLATQISAMDPGTRFHIELFSSGKGTTISIPSMTQGFWAQRRDWPLIYAQLALHAPGKPGDNPVITTDPTDALVNVLAAKTDAAALNKRVKPPNQVFLLSDGAFAVDTLPAQIGNLKRIHDLGSLPVIHTFLMLGGEKVDSIQLRDIAEQNGGEFREIS